MTDTLNNTYTVLVTSKMKVAPIEHLRIPRLELCGAYLLVDVHHVKEVLQIPSSEITMSSTGYREILVVSECMFVTECHTLLI